ncbi:hypothetical protein [Rhizobium alvei]|uniref:Phage shock protein B n=2 Tax=Rhizobium alvei TaxID=1132659 RepID=A0ABT8YIN9_9HYPH|nr:hypothetical protein [Rhizobium alvei]MDO6963100.1 hypothetical protein [Rhizobium alvei]
MTFLDLILPPLLCVFLVYLLVVLYRMFRSPSRDMMTIGRENTDVIRENNELLRELIAINKALLEKQDGPKS